MDDVVSIIIPVYNCENYVEDCLKSVESQTYDNIEVIIVNDGSSDNGIFIIDRFIEKNKNWKLLSQKNQGLSMARNNGFDISKGKYIFFLDSDDEIPKDAIEKLVTCAQKNSSDIVIGNMINYNRTGKYQNYTSKYVKNADSINYKKFPKLLSFIHAAGKLYRRDSIKDIRFIPGVKHEDNYFNLSLYTKNIRVSMITDDVYYHRIREGNDKSITQNLDYSSFRDLLINYNKVVKENDVDLKINKILSKKVINYVVLRVEKNNYKLAIREMVSFFNEMDSGIKKYKKIYMSCYRNIYLHFVKLITLLKLKK